MSKNDYRRYLLDEVRRKLVKETNIEYYGQEMTALDRILDRLYQIDALAAWRSANGTLPPVDKEVIVLTDEHNVGLLAIAFGHVVDKTVTQDYFGWNIPGVKFWMPCPDSELLRDYSKDNE